jgi:hypothetical protein
MQSKKSIYSGKLDEWLPSEPSVSVDMTTWVAWSDEKARRVILLFEHFGISPIEEGQWRRLALALAERHVKGLRQEPRGVDGHNAEELRHARRQLLQLAREIADDREIGGRVSRICAKLAEPRRRSRLPAFYQHGRCGKDRLRKDIGLALREEASVRRYTDLLRGPSVEPVGILTAAFWEGAQNGPQGSDRNVRRKQ